MPPEAAASIPWALLVRADRTQDPTTGFAAYLRTVARFV